MLFRSEFNGQKCYIAGDSEVQNATQLIVDPQYEKLLWICSKEENRISPKEIEKIVEQTPRFIEHYCSKIDKFFPEFAKFASVLRNIAAEKLDDMEWGAKRKLINDMLVVTQAGAGRIDLDKKLGGGSYGRLSGKTILPDKVKWIDRSITGLHERVRKGV